MRTRIDKAGRLVVPRGLRQQVGLLEGGVIDIDVHGAAIIIEPVAGDDLQREGGFIVIPASGQVIGDADVREQRLADQR
ncbi:MAG: hypothetical protein R6W93_10955 [Candidatus Limnocylindrales bacterium]|jgi:AbrB family looped-hinge helix DNA binding protein